MKLCQRGHPQTPENVRKTRCAVCIRYRARLMAPRYAGYMRNWRAREYRENKETFLTRNRKWREANKKRISDTGRLYFLRKKKDPSEGEVFQMMEIAKKYQRVYR